MKKILSAVLMGLGLSTYSWADTTYYGELQASYGMEDVRQADGEQKGSNDLGLAGSHAGVKGFNTINHAQDWIYNLDVAINYEDEDPELDVRRAWVGLRDAKLGEVRLGTQAMPGKLLTSSIDLFSDQYGDYNNLFDKDITADKAVSAAMTAGDVGVLVSVAKHDSEGDQFSGEKNLAGVSLNYRTKTGYEQFGGGELFAGVSMQKQDDTHQDARVAVSYETPAKHKLGVAYQRYHDDETSLGDESFSAIMLSGRYQIGNVALKSQVGVKRDESENNARLYALGAEYRLSKKTKVFFEHSQVRDSDGGVSLKGNGTETGDKAGASALGVSYRF